MVAHICDPSHSGGGDQVEGSSRPAQAQSYQGPISINKPRVVVHTHHPSYAGSVIAVQAILGIKVKPYFKS
jgi:hypothetical protein